jgi:hypothetical protein
MQVYDNNRNFNRGQLKNFRTEIISALPLISTSAEGREVIVSSGGNHAKYVLLNGEWKSNPSTMSNIEGLNISGLHSGDLIVAKNDGEFKNDSYLVINSHFSMSRLSDVRISGAQTGDVMRLSGSYWKNKKILSDTLISSNYGWSSKKISGEINERISNSGHAIISDTLISSNYGWSSKKISSDIVAKVNILKNYISTNYLNSSEIFGKVISDAIISSKTGWSSFKISANVTTLRTYISTNYLNSSEVFNKNYISTNFLTSTEILSRIISDAIISSKYGWSSKKINLDFVMSNEIKDFILSDTIISSQLGWTSQKINSVLSDYLNSTNIAANVSGITSSLTSQHFADKINAIISALVNAGLMHS